MLPAFVIKPETNTPCPAGGVHYRTHKLNPGKGMKLPAFVPGAVHRNRSHLGKFFREIRFEVNNEIQLPKIDH